MKRLLVLASIASATLFAQSFPQQITFAGIEPGSVQVNCPTVRYRVRVGETYSQQSFSKQGRGASSTSSLITSSGLAPSNFQFNIGNQQQIVPASASLRRMAGAADGSVYYLFNADGQQRSLQMAALSSFLSSIPAGTPVALATVNNSFAPRIGFTTNYQQIESTAQALPSLSGTSLAVFDSIGGAAGALAGRPGSRNIFYYDFGSLDTNSQTFRSGDAAISQMRSTGSVFWGLYPQSAFASTAFFETATNATGGLAFTSSAPSGLYFFAGSAADLIGSYYEIELRLQGGAVNASSFFLVSRTGGPTVQSNSFTANYCALEALCTLPTTGQVGVDYTGNLTARNGRAPYFWQVVDSLPPGLQLSDINLGLVRGRPTSAGVSSTNFRVSDSSVPPLQTTTVCNFTITPPPLSATCNTPAGTAGVSYNGSINVVGGTPPFRYQFAQGRLPLDLILGADTGAITGIPREVGTFPFTVSITDSSRPSPGNIQTPCSIVINPGGAVTVTAVDPNPVNAGAPDTPFRLIGSGFIAGTRVRIDGTPVTVTNFISATELTFAMTAVQLSAPRNYSIDVITPDGRTASPVTLRVLDPLRITTLNPTQLTAGSPETILTITGTGFQDGAVVRLDTTNLATAFRSVTTMQAVLTPALLATARTVNITVRNPNGQTSNALPFVITPPGPVLNTITPNLAPAGSGATQIVANGANFVNGAVIRFGNTNLTTTFNSATSLTGTIPAAMLTTPGTNDVTVRNPDGQTTLARPFLVTVPAQPVTLEVSGGTTPAVRVPNPTVVPLNGTAVLEFAGNASGLPGNYDNPQLVFANGTKTATFTLPAGQTSVNLPAIQLGSVAGTVTVRVTQLAGQGQNVLPNTPPTTTIPIARAVPVIEPGSVRITGDAGTLNVTLIATSNPRDLTQAAVTFTSGTRIDAGGTLTVNLQAPGQAWFESVDGRTNGGSFRLTIPFNLAGGAASAITQVSVTVSNSVGTSQAVSGGR